MITKKSLRNALKFSLQAEKFACDDCRTDMKNLIEGIGKAMKTGENVEFNCQVIDGHFVYAIAKDQHKGPEVKEARKKKKKKAEGEAPAKDDEEDDAEEEE